MFNKVNISSLIFLKLFDKDICSNALTPASLTPYPIHYLVYRYGFKGSYISDDLKRLILVFNKDKCLEDLNLTTKQHYNVIDLLIDSKHFHSIYHKDVFTIVELKFQKDYLEDITKIANTSAFSKVSQEFKNAMKPLNTSMPYIETSLIKYIVLKNIPLNIVMKGAKLKEYIRKLYNHEVYVDYELFISFNTDKEFISDENLENIREIGIFDLK